MATPAGLLKRASAKKIYGEGSVFEVPFETGASVLGVVARCSKPRGIVLAYFFTFVYEVACLHEALRNLQASNICLVARVGDLSLLRRDWPVVGTLDPWSREEWPVPAFVQSSDLSKRAWRISYSDANINMIVGESEIPYPPTEPFLVDSVWGAKAAQTHISKLVKAASR